MCLDENRKNDMQTHRGVYISAHTCVFALLSRTKILLGRKEGQRELDKLKKENDV